MRLILVLFVVFALIAMTYKAGEYAEVNADAINASVAAGERTGVGSLDVFDGVYAILAQ